jgi:hypothetical protein
MSRQPLASRSAVLKKIGAAIPPSGDPARDRNSVSARIAGTLTSPAELSGGPGDELGSSRTNARRNVVRFHYQGSYGGGWGRPARTRGNAEPDRPVSGPARSGAPRTRAADRAAHVAEQYLRVSLQSAAFRALPADVALPYPFGPPDVFAMAVSVVARAA